MKGNRADLNRCTARKLPGLAAQTSTVKPPPALYSHSGLAASAVAGQFPRGGAVSAAGYAAARRAAGRCTASASAASYGNASAGHAHSSPSDALSANLRVRHAMREYAGDKYCEAHRSAYRRLADDGKRSAQHRSGTEAYCPASRADI